MPTHVTAKELRPMFSISKTLAAFSMAILGSAASAQIVPTGPFIGQKSDDFLFADFRRPPDGVRVRRAI